ncbi:MAG: DUF3999 family protein [Woeseiaceae bacterium]|nr:DUF3999 family protein [Woeseiaceae bacterium]
MRRLPLLLVALLAPDLLGAQVAETPQVIPQIRDYAWGFPIETDQVASFYSLELPLEVYRSVSDPALRDAGVFNSEGNPLSRTFERPGNDRQRAERLSPLPALPLFAAVDSRDQPRELKLERNVGSSQFSFDLEDLLRADNDQQLVAYIVDTRQSEEPVAAIELAWGAVPPGFMGKVDIDGGNDLAQWTNVGSAVVAFLQEESASIEQRRIALRRGDFDYLRIRWEGLPDGWHLSQVMGVYAENGADADRKFVELEASATDPDDGGKIYSLGGAPYVDRIRVLLPEPNTVITARVMYFSERRDRWLEAGRGSFHHIIQDNHAVMSDALEIGPTRTSRFKLIMTRGPSDAVINLEAGWRPDRLLFLAQGMPPFTLATGNAADALRQFPLQRQYDDSSLAELAKAQGGIAEASLGRRFELGGPQRLIVKKQINWQTVLLWLGLVLGIAFVGFMALKTIRELRSQ